MCARKRIFCPTKSDRRYCEYKISYIHKHKYKITQRYCGLYTLCEATTVKQAIIQKSLLGNGFAACTNPIIPWQQEDTKIWEAVFPAWSMTRSCKQDNRDLLYKLCKLKFSISLINLISSFLSQREFGVSVEFEMSMPKGFTSRGATKFRPVAPHSTAYMIDTPQTPGVYLGLFVVDSCIYAIDRNGCYVLRKLQRGLSATETWCER
jgi:hypothetical protein